MLEIGSPLPSAQFWAIQAGQLRQDGWFSQEKKFLEHSQPCVAHIFWAWNESTLPLHRLRMPGSHYWKRKIYTSEGGVLLLVPLR